MKLFIIITFLSIVAAVDKYPPEVIRAAPVVMDIDAIQKDQDRHKLGFDNIKAWHKVIKQYEDRLIPTDMMGTRALIGSCPSDSDKWVQDDYCDLCSVGYARIDFLQKDLCITAKKTQLAMDKSCKQASISCSGTTYFSMFDDFVCQPYIGMGSGNIKFTNPDGICSIGGRVIEDCQTSEEKRITINWLVIKKQLYLVDDLNVHTFEDASTIHSYKCTGGTSGDHTRGACSGDNHYCGKFGCTAVENCTCVIDNSRAKLVHKDKLGWVLPSCFGRSIVKALVKVKQVDRSTLSDCTDCRVDCGSKSLLISSRSMIFKMAEVCRSSKCVFIKIDSSKTPELALPPSLLTTSGPTKLTLWTSDDKMMIFQVSCSALTVCEFIDCFWCNNAWVNMKCWIWYQYILSLGGLILMLLLIAIALVILIKVISGLIFIGRPVWWVGRTAGRCIHRGWIKTREYYAVPDDDVDIPLQQVQVNNAAVPPRYIGKMGLVIMLIMLASVESCTVFRPLTAESNLCTLNSDKSVVCSVSSEMRLSVPPLKQDLCVSISSPTGSPIGVVKITPESVKLRCQKETLYHTTTPRVGCVSWHRCRNAGDCDGDKCESFKETDGSEYWGKEMNKAGRSACSRTCGCAGCGCFFCASSCLWYRSYLENRDKVSYEAVSCPTWTYEVQMSILVKNAKGEEVSKDEVQINTDQEAHFRSGSLNLIGITKPPQPILNKCFLLDKAGKGFIAECSRKGELAAGKVGEVQCDTENDAMNLNTKCIYSKPAVNTIIQESTVSCSSTFIDLERLKTGSSLPKVLDGMVISSDNGKLYATLGHTSEFEIQLNMKNVLLSSLALESSCSVLTKNISGCYSCNEGARIYIDVSCTSSSLLTVNCLSGLRSSISASAIESTVMVIAHYNHSSVQDSCVVSNSFWQDKIEVRGELEYNHLADPTTSETIESISIGMDKKGLNPIWSWLDVTWFSNWYGWLKIAGIIIVGLVCLAVVIYFIRIFQSVLSAGKKNN